MITRNVKMRFAWLPLEQIHPGNPPFYNSFSEQQYVDQLIAHPDHHTDPIEVRAKGQGFVILNGHHRYQAARRAGRADIAALIVVEGDVEVLSSALEAWQA